MLSKSEMVLVEFMNDTMSKERKTQVMRSVWPKVQTGTAVTGDFLKAFTPEERAQFEEWATVIEGSEE